MMAVGYGVKYLTQNFYGVLNRLSDTVYERYFAFVISMNATIFNRPGATALESLSVNNSAALQPDHL